MRFFLVLVHVILGTQAIHNTYVIAYVMNSLDTEDGYMCTSSYNDPTIYDDQLCRHKQMITYAANSSFSSICN